MAENGNGAGNGNGNGKRTLIDRESLVPIGVAAGALCSILLGYTWLDNRFDGLEQTVEVKGVQQTAQLQAMKSEQATAIAVIDTSISSIQEDVSSMERVLSDRITKSEFDTWIKLLFAKNPSLSQP